MADIDPLRGQVAQAGTPCPAEEGSAEIKTGAAS